MHKNIKEKTLLYWNHCPNAYNSSVDSTVLTIAHRLHTVMDSDKIFIMDAGRAVECVSRQGQADGTDFFTSIVWPLLVE